MPKIPTFESQARPTAEVSSLKTQFQVPVESAGSMFGAAAKVLSSVDEYYVREQAIKDKTESTKAYLELSNDLDTIEQGSSKILDPSKAQSTFKDQFSFLAKQKIDSMENKAAARLLEDKLSLDLITRSSKVVKGSRDQLDLQYNNTWNTEQQVLISKYLLSKDDNEKNILKTTIDSNIVSRNFYNNDGEVKLQEELNKSNASIFEMDIEKDLSNKNYGSAKKKLEDIESSKFLKAEKRAELYQKVSKFEVSAIAEKIAIDAPYGLMSDIEAVVSTQLTSQVTDSEKRVEATSLIDKEINFKLKTISEKGSAEYFINKDPQVNLAYAKVVQDPSQFGLFKQALDKKYNEQNIPEQYRTYVPYNKIKEIGDVLKGTQNVDQKLKVINSLQNTYGTDVAPSIFKQLVKDGLPIDIQVAVSTNSSALKKDILSAISTKDLESLAKSKISGLKGASFANIKTNIMTDIKDFEKVILSQSDGAVNKQELMLSLQNTLYQATLQRIVKDGLNPENARKSVTKEFKNDYDTTPGTYFIPKDVNGIAVNNAAVKDKADALLLLVEKSDYLERFHVDGGFAHYATLAGNQNVLPENIKLSDANTFNTYVKNTMVNSMKKHSKWLLNSNSTGIVLHVELANGTIPIVNAKGEKIEFYFADIPNKNPKIKSIDSIEPGTGLPIRLLQSEFYQVSP
jgi:hypothetical protein